MLAIRKLIEGFPVADARSALYYASRYIKQAETFDEYGKDVFDDESRSAPNSTVRALAKDIIKTIESQEGMKSADLVDSRVIEILDEISSIEEALSLDFTESELAAAEAFTSTLSAPPVDEN